LGFPLSYDVDKSLELHLSYIDEAANSGGRSLTVSPAPTAIGASQGRAARGHHRDLTLKENNPAVKPSTAVATSANV
jgi:hypothetical protein